MQQVARRGQLGRAARVDFYCAFAFPVTPLLATISEANWACLGLNAATAKRTSGTACRTWSAALRNQGRLCSTSCVREPGRMVTNGRAGGRWMLEERFVHRRVAGTSSKKGWPTKVALQPRWRNHSSSNGRLQAPWSAQAADFFRSPGGPRPDLRRHVVENGNAVDLGPPGDPPIEAGIIDQDHGIGPLVAEVAVGRGRPDPRTCAS